MAIELLKKSNQPDIRSDAMTDKINELIEAYNELERRYEKHAHEFFAAGRTYTTRPPTV